MNLFAILINSSRQEREQAIVEIQNMVKIYPELDLKTLWSFYIETSNFFLVSMQNPLDVVFPRKYRVCNDNYILLYDGLPIDSSFNFKAFDADNLLKNKDSLTDVLEGKFIIVIVRQNPFQLTIMTDPLGIAQLYQADNDDKIMLSNSVRLIKNVSKLSEPDALGISTFLTLGWTVADRTLEQDIRVLPGGHVFSWVDNNRAQKTSYFDFRNNNDAIMSSDKSAHLEEIKNEWIGMLRHLGENFKKIYCPLTGGRDSRLITALLQSADISVLYYTCGDQASSDVETAKIISNSLALKYQHCAYEKVPQDELQRAIRQLVLENDGLVSLKQIGDYLFEPVETNELAIVLNGAGGEILRSYYGNPFTFLFCKTKDSLAGYFKLRYVKDWHSLVKQNAIEDTNKYIDAFFESHLDSGAKLEDILDIFYAIERVRRWAGSQSRKLSSKRDFTMLFNTKRFLRYTFSVPAQMRFMEPLHYNLTKSLSPLLHGLPFSSEPWRPQIPALCLLQQGKIKINKFLRRRLFSSSFLNRIKNFQSERSSRNLEIWFDNQKSIIVDDVLSKNNSLIWDFIDRRVYERMMKDDSITARIANIEGFYRIWTLHHYFNQCRDL